MNLRRLLLIPALAISLGAGGQTIPVNTKFGAVSDEELQMTVYPPDTSAAVVLLYCKQEVEAAFSSSLQFGRKVIHTERIKILKESGKDYPDFKIFYSTSCTPWESVSNIKLTTYNLVDGKKTADKLSRKMIFDEKVSDTRRSVSFSAPNVRVGSVVEVTFTFESPYVADIGTIFLQKDVPVNISEAEFTSAEYFHFSRILQGFIPSTTNTDIRQASLLLGSGRLDYEVNVDKHRAVDVPALTSAPYCYCPDMYRLGFTYDLQSISIPEAFRKDYSYDWAQVDEMLRDERCVKEFYAKSHFSEDAARIASSGLSEAEQVVAIRNAVAEKVRWNKRQNIFPSSAKAIKEQEGSSADINALTGAALNEMGFKADPVFLMTRDRGLLMSHHVSMDAYNVVILKVTAPSGTAWIFDASDKSGYLNVLPTYYLVERARVIPKGEKGYWADLSKLCRNQLIDNAIIEVTADGSIKGSRTERGFNNWAATMKKAYSHYDDAEKFAEKIENEDGVEIDDIAFQGDKDWTPDATLTYSFSGHANAAGDIIYLKPFLSKYHDESDFRSEERKIPVEFAYPEIINYSALVTIPEGFTVESMPRPVSIKCPSSSSQVMAQCNYDGGRTVTMNFRFTNNGRLVTPDHYNELRDFWAELCNIYNFTVVLKNNNALNPSTSGSATGCGDPVAQRELYLDLACQRQLQGQRRSARQ
ncbi:MAG: DUF3857 domain-containing protein [Bacteroidales bacterium]|nr:DUF3857 domain-containing protein [Bacteroidales bacterium]